MTRKFVIITSSALLLLGLVMWQLGLRAQGELKAVATEQFNRQQLILAQKLAQDLEQHFSFLGASLLELSGILHRHPALMGEPEKALPPFQEILRQSEVLAIGYVPAGGGAVSFFNDKGLMSGPLVLDYGAFLDWARGSETGKLLTGRVESPPQGPFAGKTILRMATRYWPHEAPVSVGVEGPGVLFFVVDAVAVARRYAHDVRSGQTGYAWVIDQRGYFLDHYEEDFIARDAFEVRKRRDPGIDFTRIDQLMREKIMKGEEGVDWYVSGWHRGAQGEMRKLIAYAPAHIATDQPDPVVWGVALAAPVDEVEGIIGKVALREMFMVAVFQVVVFTGLAVTMYFAFRWSANLKTEVEARTAELREARDRIRQNLQELLETQERLIRSERFAAVGEAAAHISHEIRNPLMLMGGFARQVRRSLPEDGREAEKLRLIEEEAKRLETMLEEVRDFTRPAAPKLAPRDLNATVWDTVTLLEQELASRGVTLRANLDKTLPPAVHDPGQVRQVVLNLVKNAAEAMTQGGAVTIVSRARDGFAEVVVKDDGPGMAPEEAAKAFNPFYTTKERGTGLGLAVCERIARDHGGAIRLDTEKGKGCAFTLSLPLERRGAEQRA
ncbi:Sporulation kinase E [Fundidesulfovibrio magnetotacticus]|uniref:histidine kinase n=1 Tax=Fundidesulfovibrio magnetotacticus TaxID=2730080 RepID=A0A6V8M084_9BACT|nr:ATP-binding protein [Fundidesulfovibrio magnetotacticus]GFK95267.1 Sporulation kinase E [Fundidesulfovibrio magnetotacticus]